MVFESMLLDFLVNCIFIKDFEILLHIVIVAVDLKAGSDGSLVLEEFVLLLFIPSIT
jgi:hypothetical protein